MEVAVSADLSVTGNATFSLGAGDDLLDQAGNNMDINGDLSLFGVNTFVNNNVTSVGGNFLMDVSSELESTLLQDASPLVVVGDFTYLGSDADDSILLDVSTTIGGNIFIDAAGGNNAADLVNVNGGTTVTYLGGDQVDSVSFAGTGSAPVLNFHLAGGDDLFVLEAGSSFSSPLTVDMGSGADIFTNQFGAFTFDASILGASGFDHVYQFASDKLTSTQVEDLGGSVVVDNQGPGDAIRFNHGGTSLLMPVMSLQVNMQDSSLTDLDINLNGILSGDLGVDLGDGLRQLRLVGLGNSIGGDLLVSAGSGDQTVNLNVASPLTVSGVVMLDLNGGNDTLSDNVNGIDIGGDLSLYGVNQFTNLGTLLVGGHWTIDNRIANGLSMIVDAGTIDLTGDFTYLGGAADDTVDFSSGFPGLLIGGDIDLQMGDGNNAATLQSGVFGGTSISYLGGSGMDEFVLGLAGNDADVTANLGAGDDLFELQATASVHTLFVDFGAGNDMFVNDYGAFDFPATLLSLDGFNHSYDPTASSLNSVQVAATGGLVTFDNNGAGDSIRVTGNTMTVLGPVDHLSITMLDGSLDNLDVDLDSALAGDLMVDLNNGLRSFRLTGINNTIGGNLSVEAGAGAQSVAGSLNQALEIGGDFDMDLGSGNDSLSFNGNGATVPGTMNLSRVNNLINDDLLSIGGDLNVDVSTETQNTQIVDSAIISVAGNLTYLGSDAGDILQLNANTAVGGDINIDTRNGANVAAILGIFGGSEVNYAGGNGVDVVTFGTTGAQADVNVRLRSGNDTFNLESGASIAPDSLRVDFGSGDDTFLSDYGQFDFNAQLLNLDGYNAFFDLATGNLDVVQVTDTGDVTIDNNGPSSAIQFGVGTMNTLTPAEDLRLILLANSSTNVTADFDNVRVGNTVFQLRSGDRDVFFTGSNNSFEGLLRVEAADGTQNVHVAETNGLAVNGTFIFNGRDGDDTLMADRSVFVNGAMLLRGVNDFVNNQGVNVSGDFNVITLLEDQDTRLISNNSFFVGGNFTYLGGGGVDAINFKSSGATIGGFTYIDIADSNDAVNKQRVSLTGGFTTDNLVVDGSTAIAGNYFATDAATVVTQDVIVNFASSSPNNTAEFFGNYGGTYGTYRGGTSSDFVVFGATANNMLFASLMGAGNDVFTIDAGADLDFLYVDFGPGNDFLDNQLGNPLPFSSNIFNN